MVYLCKFKILNWEEINTNLIRLLRNDATPKFNRMLFVSVTHDRAKCERKITCTFCIKKKTILKRQTANYNDFVLIRIPPLENSLSLSLSFVRISINDDGNIMIAIKFTHFQTNCMQMHIDAVAWLLICKDNEFSIQEKFFYFSS